MSRKANCWDNAITESFFKTSKCELIYRSEFCSWNDAYRQIYDYINWYNNQRIQQILGYLTPKEMESLIKSKTAKKAY